MNLADIESAVRLAPQASEQVSRFGGPGAMLGRVLGLNGEEAKQGFPTWAWVSLAIVGGVVGGYFLRPYLEGLQSNGRQVIHRPNPTRRLRLKRRRRK